MKEKKLLFPILIVMISLLNVNAQQKIIPNTMFGINWQFTDSVGTGSYLVTGGKVNKLTGKIKNSHPKLIRIGGNDFDQRGATFQQFAQACDSIINQLGAIPLVEIPIYRKFNTTGTFNFTPTDAVALITYLNSPPRNFNIQYISLGNEPDEYPNNSDAGIDSIASKFKRFVPVIKTSFGNIKVVGPSLTNFYARDSVYGAYPKIIKALMGGYSGLYAAQNISGQIPALPGKYYIDIIDFHDYAGVSNTTLNSANYNAKRDSLVNYPKNKFNSIIQEMYGTGGYVATANTTRPAGNQLTFAVTEMNVNYYNPPYSSPIDDNNKLKNSIYGVGCNSFLAGQHWASMFMEAMKSGNCTNISPWSIHESGGDKSSTDFGYLDGAYTVAKERSTYYHMQMLTENFNTKFCTGTIPSGQNYVRVFGSLNSSNELVVMILNMDTTNNFKFALRLENSATAFASANPLKMKIDGGINIEYTDSIENQSTTLLNFNLAGTLIKRCTYEMRGNLNVGQAPTCTTICPAVADLYMRDYPSDIDASIDAGVEPDPLSGYMYLSNDIWVRDTTDGFINQYQVSNPTATTGRNNYVYVRVRNRGCQPTLGTEKLHVSWAKAATSLSWPISWNGTLDLDSSSTKYASAGDTIGYQTIPVIPAGGNVILQFRWSPPNPSDYAAINTEPWHFCLLARIVAANDTMFARETTDLAANVIKNNNIVWRNITLIDSIPGIIGGGSGCGTDIMKEIGVAVAVGNNDLQPAAYDIKFSVPSKELANPITKEGTVIVALDNKLYEKWVQGGKKGSGFKEILSPPMSNTGQSNNQINGNSPIVVSGRKAFEITGTTTTFENITFAAREFKTTSLMVLYPTDPVTTKQAFVYDITQNRTSTGELIGGVRYKIKKPAPITNIPDAGSDRTIKKGCLTTLTANPVVDCGIYYWFDASGKVIGKNATINVSPQTTTTYTLKVLTPNGYAVEDKVTVNVTNQLCERKREIIGVSPNPGHDFITVKYRAEETTRAQIRILKADNTVDRTYNLNLQNSEITLNISDCPFGVYGVILVCDGIREDSKNIIIH